MCANVWTNVNFGLKIAVKITGTDPEASPAKTSGEQGLSLTFPAGSQCDQSRPARVGSTHWDRRLSSRPAAGAARCRAGGVWRVVAARGRRSRGPSHGRFLGSSAADRAPGASSPRARGRLRAGAPSPCRPAAHSNLWGYLRDRPRLFGLCCLEESGLRSCLLPVGRTFGDGTRTGLRRAHRI